LFDIIREGIDVVDPEMERQTVVDGERLIGQREDALEVAVDVLEA
jgi:hypothetical protein